MVGVTRHFALLNETLAQICLRVVMPVRSVAARLAVLDLRDFVVEAVVSRTRAVAAVDPVEAVKTRTVAVDARALIVAV
jgi:hypothetical protein